MKCTHGMSDEHKHMNYKGLYALLPLCKSAFWHHRTHFHACNSEQLSDSSLLWSVQYDGSLVEVIEENSNKVCQIRALLMVITWTLTENDHFGLLQSWLWVDCWRV